VNAFYENVSYDGFQEFIDVEVTSLKLATCNKQLIPFKNL